MVVSLGWFMAVMLTETATLLELADTAADDVTVTLPVLGSDTASWLTQGTVALPKSML